MARATRRSSLRSKTTERRARSTRTPVTQPRERVQRDPVERDPEPIASAQPIVASTPEIEKRIDALVNAIRKEHGDDSISRLSDLDTDVKTFPIHLPNIETIIGHPGFPLAKLVHITGGESVGKSTFVNYLAAQAQHAGMVVLFVDGEDSEYGDRAAQIGVNTSLLPIAEPETLEDAFALMETSIERMKKWRDPSLVILDSVAAFPMRVDLERPYDKESRRAARAAFLSANLPKLVRSWKGSSIGMVFVNQIREKADARPFESPYYAPGGRALKHWCHLTLGLSRIGQVRDGSTPIGITTRFRVDKSKIGIPLRTATINMLFDGTVVGVEETARDD